MTKKRYRRRILPNSIYDRFVKTKSRLAKKSEDAKRGWSRVVGGEPEVGRRQTIPEDVEEVGCRLSIESESLDKKKTLM